MSCLTLAAIGLHALSYHSVPAYNNINPGLYVQTRCGFTAGAYYNSERRLSLHAGYAYDLPRIPLFASVGVATGYRAAPAIPMAMIGARARLGAYAVRVGYIPKLGKLNDTHVIHLMLERRF